MSDSNNGLVTVFIDGVEVKVPDGTLVTEASRKAGIEIPVFCYHPKLRPVGMCRMCLGEVGTPQRDRETGEVQVDEEGNPVIRWFPKLQTTCTTQVSDGMVVRLRTEEVETARRAVLEFLLSSHPLDCPVCDKGGECPLQDLTFTYGPGVSRFDYEDKFHFAKPVPLGPLIALDRERCIQCGRCVRFQDEIAGDPVLSFENRGRGMEIVSYSDPAFHSKFSGNTTDICPVGALTSRDFRFESRVWELTNTQSVCPHCAVGCNIIVGHRSGEIRRIMPRDNDAVNEIWVCDKGRFAHHFVNSPDRLTAPMVKENGEWVVVEWQDALEHIASRLRALRDERSPEGDEGHGSDALGGIAGERSANEDFYVFQRFVRTVMGTNNVDCWRQPANLADPELIAQVGVGTGTNLLDVGPGDALVVIGADVEEEAPVLMLRMKQAAERGAYLVVAGGRPTKLGRYAAENLSIPHGSEAHLLVGLLKVIMGDELADADAVAGQAGDTSALEQGLGELALADLARTAGVAEDDLRRIARELARAKNLIVSYGRDAVAGGAGPALLQALANLLIVTGHVGRPNNGLLPLLPHNNSQGAADMGVSPLWLPGYQRLDDPVARENFRAAWGRDVPEAPGLDVAAMLDGSVRGLWIMGADPAGDRPDVRGNLEALDFLVVQELFMTDTARLADVVLPAAAFAERDGTFTNTERRVQRFEQALRSPGVAKSDWEILTDVAHLMGSRFPYADAAAVMDEITTVVPIYADMTYPQLGLLTPFGSRTRSHFIYEGTSYVNVAGSGRQWPVAAEDPDAVLELRWEAPPVAPARDPDYPLLLVPQKRLYDDGTLIEKSRILEAWVPPPVVYVSPDDMATFGVEDGQPLDVVSRAGRARLTARSRADVPAGVALVPLGLRGSDGQSSNVGVQLGLDDGIAHGRLELVDGD